MFCGGEGGNQNSPPDFVLWPFRGSKASFTALLRIARAAALVSRLGRNRQAADKQSSDDAPRLQLLGRSQLPGLKAGECSPACSCHLCQPDCCPHNTPKESYSRHSCSYRIGTSGEPGLDGAASCCTSDLLRQRTGKWRQGCSSLCTYWGRRSSLTQNLFLCLWELIHPLGALLLSYGWKSPPFIGYGRGFERDYPSTLSASPIQSTLRESTHKISLEDVLGRNTIGIRDRVIPGRYLNRTNHNKVRSVTAQQCRALQSAGKLGRIVIGAGRIRNNRSVFRLHFAIILREVVDFAKLFKIRGQRLPDRPVIQGLCWGPTRWKWIVDTNYWILKKV